MRFYHTESSVFLGHFRGNDLYFDNPNGLPTVIARYGSKSAEYRSGLYWADYDPVLSRAKEIAYEAGLLSDEDIEECTDLDDEISSCPHCLKAEALGDETAICEEHMAELEEHFACVLGKPSVEEPEHSVCVH